MTDTTKTTDNVVPRRRATDRQAPATRAVLPGGCVVLAFPGCAVPVVNKPRRGRLPASIPSLSRARAERQQRAEEARQRAERLRILESLFSATGVMVETLRDNLRSFEATESVSSKGAA